MKSLPIPSRLSNHWFQLIISPIDRSVKLTILSDETSPFNAQLINEQVNRGYVVYGTKSQTSEILNKNLKSEVRFLSKDWMVVLDMIAETDHHWNFLLAVVDVGWEQ
ncbi:hypothetical protein NC653_039153 [Populus alba x Populus x berolinensis]|uniref:Uncharacterized protein n=1 Tax=Populus alba x Populus x berolinensis TaxID=444605 RepID=A0AAD6LAK5_9ROSI|nr:hypothetical protein NC653_039153 [Populus alba x Populus x berolinensis]